MSLTRVTERTISQLTLDGLQNNLARLQAVQQKMSTGKELSRPSDNPTDAVSALTFRADVRRFEQYSRNAQDGLDWLGMADNTLTGMLDQVQRANSLALQGLNASSGPAERQALAAEVGTIRDSLIGMANTSYLGRPIFAGTTKDPSGAAYDANGIYKGDNGTIFRTVAPNVQVQVNLPGPQVFGSDTSGLFASLAKLQQDLQSGNLTGVGQDMTSLQTSTDGVQNILAEVGARYNRIDTMKSLADSHLDSLKSSLSEVEDIDLPKTITDLQLQQVAYQSSLAASAKVIQPSLVDFLR